MASTRTMRTNRHSVVCDWLPNSLRSPLFDDEEVAAKEALWLCVQGFLHEFGLLKLRLLLSRTRPLVTEAELTIMDLLWRSRVPLSSRQITERLNRIFSIHRQTVTTLISRLKKKGFVGNRLVGRNRYSGHFLYFPLKTEYRCGELEHQRFMDHLLYRKLASPLERICRRCDVPEQTKAEIRRIAAELNRTRN